MKRTIMAGTGALALALATAPAALATQGEDPLLTQSATSECGSAALTFTVGADAFSGYTWSYFKGANDGSAHNHAGDVTVKPGESKTVTVEFTEDQFDGSGYVSYVTTAGPETNEYLGTGTVGVDTDCQEGTTPPDDGNDDSQDDGKDGEPSDGNEPPADDGKDGDTPPAKGGTESGDKDQSGDVEQVGDDANADGTAPTPTPQEGHIAVTG